MVQRGKKRWEEEAMVERGKGEEEMGKSKQGVKTKNKTKKRWYKAGRIDGGKQGGREKRWR